jgi:hypothetical protein
MSTLLEQASLVMIPSGYKEDIVYSQIPTSGAGDLSFTRASNGTRINSAGLVEVVPWNLLEQSEGFDNAVWGADAGNSKTANTTTAPNGTVTADTITASPTNVMNVYQIITTNDGVFSYTVYLKKDATNLISIYIYQTFGSSAFKALGEINFDNGTFTPSIGTGTIESVGNGWFRVSVTANLLSGANSFGIYTTSDTGTRNVYIWGAQLNIGSTAKPYFPTTDRLNVPRLTYQNGGGGCPSLLLEKQSTNYIDFSNTSNWGVSSTITKTQNTTDLLSPDGTNNATKIVSTAGTGDTSVAFSIPDGTVTLSFYGRVASGTKTLVVDVRNNSGTVSSSSPTLTTEWQRFTLTNSTSGTGSSGAVWIYPNGAGTFYIYGVQAESSSYATSLILTTGASATRVADACYKTGISSLIGQTSGSVFFDFTVDSVTQPGDPVLWYMKDGGAGERYVELYSNGNLVYAEIDGSGPIATITKSSLTVGRHKCAIAYATNDFVFYVDGVQIGTDTSGTPNGFSTFGLQYYLSVYTGQQKVNQAAIFKTRLTNAELASLTTI